MAGKRRNVEIPPFSRLHGYKMQNKSKEKCKTRERPNERKGGSHELDSGKWSRDHR